MIPFYFGSSQRRLFGLYAPAGRRRSPARAVVLCYPWGDEYLRAHRSFCRLGSILSAAGFDVLRFDYSGTGDADGDLTDATLEGWEADIETAIEEIKDTTSATVVTLGGLRLGAALAARVAVRNRATVNELVLWDPVVTGDEHVAELWSAPPPFPLIAGQVAVRPAERGGGREVEGFALTDTMTRELRAIDLRELAPVLPDRTLLIASEPQPSHAGLAQALSRRPGRPLALEYLPSPRAWVDDEALGVGAIPVEIFKRITEWLG